MATIKSPIKVGNFIFFVASFVKRIVKTERGIIHKARSNFTVVATWSASFPNLTAAPTTELVS